MIFFYLKIVTEHLINEDLKKDVFLFNTYFMTKLLGEYITDINKCASVSKTINKDFVRQIRLNASKLLRWVKNINIF
jgi:Ulp1 family protease